MRVPWTARRSKQSILKEINPGISSPESVFSHLYLAASVWRLRRQTSRPKRKHESPGHIQRSPVSAYKFERRDPLPAWSGKNSRHSRHISRVPLHLQHKCFQTGQIKIFRLIPRSLYCQWEKLPQCPWLQARSAAERGLAF